MSKRTFLRKINVGDLIYWPIDPNDGPELGSVALVLKKDKTSYGTVECQLLWVKNGMSHSYSEDLLQTRCYHIRHYRPDSKGS
jgi:hypothetical protein